MEKTPTFAEFWVRYPQHRDRRRAENAWNRLSAADKRKALAAVTAYKADCDSRGISYMYGQGYLNNRRWEDDFSSSSGGTAPPHYSTVSQIKSSITPKGMEEW